ncbi:MAG: heavy metal transporter [Anaerolineae bacterium SM23_ 63]|nr:MAG: heavy metal transporter [Anaerolineae bacterium SM23_ 63]HEY47907.1 heavy metal transporter [Anaerolineae bacterium]
MTTITYNVPSISCGHCVHTIQMELGDIIGVSKVQAYQENRQVTVEFEPPATEEQIEATLMEINYPPVK